MESTPSFLRAFPIKKRALSFIPQYLLMKSKISEEIKDLFSQTMTWAKLEIEYVKLTAAEKLIILISTMIIGAVFVLFLLPIFIMLLFALAGLFRMFMSPPLAYLSVAGIAVLMLAIVLVFRKVLVINVVSKFVTKLFLERKNDHEHNHTT